MIQVPTLTCGCRPGHLCDEQAENIRRSEGAYAELIHLEAELERRDLKEYGRVQLEQRLGRAREDHREAVQAVRAHRLKNAPNENDPAGGEADGAQEGTEAEHRPSCPTTGKVTASPFRLHTPAR